MKNYNEIKLSMWSTTLFHNVFFALLTFILCLAIDSKPILILGIVSLIFTAISIINCIVTLFYYLKSN